MTSKRGVFSAIFTMILVACLAMTGNAAHAQSTSSNGPSGVGLSVTGTDASGAMNGITTKFKTITNSLIQSAVNDSSSLNTKSDKFAGALAVLALVMASLRFAGSAHPTRAWIEFFETLITLSMFAAVYTGYTQAAPGFYNWFAALAASISGVGNFSTIFSGCDVILNAVNKAWGTSAIPSSVGGTISAAVTGQLGADISHDFGIFITCIGALVCYAIMFVTGVFFVFFMYVGVVQSAVGIIFGKIAIALGFHRMTRGFFTSWLNYMVNSGMYVAVAAAMQSLAINPVMAAIARQVPASAGTTAVTFESCIALCGTTFILFCLALEIPKIAGMFGAGAPGGAGFAGTAAKAGLATAKGYPNDVKQAVKAVAKAYEQKNKLANEKRDEAIKDAVRDAEKTWNRERRTDAQKSASAGSNGNGGTGGGDRRPMNTSPPRNYWRDKKGSGNGDNGNDNGGSNES